MDIFDAPVVLSFGFNGSALVDPSANPVLVLAIGGSPAVY